MITADTVITTIMRVTGRVVPMVVIVEVTRATTAARDRVATAIAVLMVAAKTHAAIAVVKARMAGVTGTAAVATVAMIVIDARR
jgi:hypothetical protein